MMSILAGHVYPRPSFALRWRFDLMSFFMLFHRIFPLTKRHERFSLLAAPEPPPPLSRPASVSGAE